MIIPPDPEKDPNIYASSSTPSLVPSETSIQPPDAVHHRNTAFGYPFDDGWRGEQLPPYEGNRQNRWSMGPRTSSRNSHRSIDDVFSDVNAPIPNRRQPPNIVIPPIPHRPVSYPNPGSPASSSSSLTPTGPTSRAILLGPASSHTGQSPTTTLVSPPGHSSTTKLWESSALSSSSSEGRRRRRKRGNFFCLPIPSIPSPSLPLSPRTRKFWNKYKRWIQATLVFLLIGIGLCVGLLVGFKAGAGKSTPDTPAPVGYTPWNDQTKNGRKIMNWSPGTSLNLTYVPSRDGPDPADGNMTLCNNFTSFVPAISPFSLLYTPYSPLNATLASFNLPSNTSDLYFIARGLGALGTLEFVGNDSPPPLASNSTGIQVDVIIQYTGPQDVKSFMKVCQMVRNGGVGVGVYTPTQTDGKISNPALLDPSQLPSLHIVVRLPPVPLHVPSLTISLDRMSIRFGNMQNMVDFGILNFTSGRGSVDVDYIAAQDVSTILGAGSISGLWNISESLNLNTTDGAILADIILYDPSIMQDNSTTLPPTISNFKRSYKASPRELSPIPVRNRGLINPRVNTLNAGVSSLIPTRHITTNFATADGPSIIAYLHHPPSVSIDAAVIADQVDFAVHPNYVGPFAARNIWGQVRLVQPNCATPNHPHPSSSSPSSPAGPGSGSCSDPQGWGRTRQIALGPIDFSDQIYQDAGLNSTMLLGSNVVTGAAYWSNAYENPMLVQNGTEGRGNGLMISARWGDIRLSFDGT